MIKRRTLIRSFNFSKKIEEGAEFLLIKMYSLHHLKLFAISIMASYAAESNLSTTRSTNGILNKLQNCVNTNYTPSINFPFHQLWNVSKKLTCDDNLEFYTNVTRNSCFFNTSANKTSKPTCCECNDHCMYYGTCCIDKYWNDTHTQQTVQSLDTYLSFFLEKSREIKKNTFGCKDPFPFISGAMGIEKEYYLMVTSCIEGANVDDIHACAQDHNHLSAVYGDDNFIYKNYFCARCNFVESFKQVNFRLVNCDQRLIKTLKQVDVSNIKETFDKLTKCKLIIDNNTLADVPLKVCSKATWPSECKKNGVSSELCLAYSGIYNGLMNHHCMLCGTVSPRPGQGHCLIQDRSLMPHRFPVLTVSVLFVLSNNPIPSNDAQDARKLCEEGSVPNFEENKCVPFSCPPFYQVVNSSCVNILSSLNTVKGSRVLKCLLRNDPFIFAAYRSFNTSYVQNVMYEFANIPLSGLKNFTVHGDQTVIKIKQEYVDRLLTHFLDRSPKTDKFLTIFDWLIIMPYNPIITQQIEFHKTFPGERLCAKYKIVNSTFNKLTNSCSVMYNNKKVEPGYISMSIKITRKEASQHVAICERFYLQQSSCKLDILTKDFRYSYSGKLFDSRNGKINHVYDVEEYIPLKEGVGICFDSGIDIIKTLQQSRGMISFAGHFLSCICHALVLFTFGLLDDEFPGYGLVSLCVSLFLSDVLLLLIISFHTFNINVISKFCEMIAMCLHFSLLSVQACAVVSSVDLFKQLGQAIIVRRSHHTAKEFFRHRAVLMFFFPLLIVIGAMLLDLNKIVITGYGAHGVCLFTGLSGKIIFYIVPSILTFLTSIILISYTVYKVSKICRDNKKTLHGSGRRHLSIPLIALKLVLTYGISEGLGFIQIPGDNLSIESQTFNIAFDFLYTILRSYRGCIIFVIYICRKSVFIKYKEIFARVKHSVVSSDSTRNVSQSNVKEAKSTNEHDITTSQRNNSVDSDKVGNRVLKAASLLEINAIVHNTVTGDDNIGPYHTRSKSVGTREVTNIFETRMNYSSARGFGVRDSANKNFDFSSSPNLFGTANNISCNGSPDNNVDVKLAFECSLNGFLNSGFRSCDDTKHDYNGTKEHDEIIGSDNSSDYFELVTSVKLNSSENDLKHKVDEPNHDDFALPILPSTLDQGGRPP